MKKKITVVLILMLLVATIILPASGEENYEKSEIENKQFNYEHVGVANTSDEIDWWSQFQHDPENIGFSTSTAPETNSVLWKFKDKYEYSMYASAVVVDSRVYTASVGVYVQDTSKTKKDNCSGKVYCLDAKTGDLIWQYTSRYGLHATPAVDDGRVYVCSGLWFYQNDSVRLIRLGDAFCLDAEDGNLIWEVLDCGYVEGGPVVIDGNMYFSSKIYYPKKISKTYCLNASSGEEIWNRTLLHTRGPVAISDGKVYVGLTEGEGATTEKLMCLDASNGKDIWSWDEGDRDEIIAAPTVVNGKVYVATKGYGVITPDGDKYFTGGVYCLDAENGNLLWKSDINATIYWCSPAVAYGNIYVGTSSTVGVGRDTGLFGTFYCINATDGTLVWKRHRLFDTMTLFAVLPGCYSPAVADGKVYFGATGRWSANMYCLDAFTGETIWKYKKFTFFRCGSFFSPAIADGKVYAGFENIYIGHKAKLFCFGK